MHTLFLARRGLIMIDGVDDGEDGEMIRGLAVGKKAPRFGKKNARG